MSAKTSVANEAENEMIDDEEFFTEEEEDVEEGMIVEQEEDVESEKPAPLTPLDCLFCNISSSTIDHNVAHMKKRHGFSLPYPGSIIDSEGLMQYLAELIDEYNVCLQCNKQFDDRLGVRNHMADLNHMQLYFHLETNGDDLSEFYGELPQPVSNLADVEVWVLYICCDWSMI